MTTSIVALNVMEGDVLTHQFIFNNQDCARTF